MLREYDIEGNLHDKVAEAIKMLQELEPPDGYYVAFSGGKDSQCVAELCRMAGVKYDLHYALTTVDPPELVQFIKKHYPEAWENRHVNHWPDGRPITMWNLIPVERVPPTRMIRYCCKVLKENGGVGRVTVTGVRRAESANRKRKQGLVTVPGAGKRERAEMAAKNIEWQETPSGGVIMLNNDNGAAREVIEMCYRKRKTLVNPIIMWEDEDVWEFLNDVAKVPHCELYDRGMTRLGCLGCPMSTRAAEELDRYPKYKASYVRAFQRMVDKRKEDGIETKLWDTGWDVLDWWLNKKNAAHQIAGQTTMFDVEGTE